MLKLKGHLNKLDLKLKLKDLKGHPDLCQMGLCAREFSKSLIYSL
jgi:hypothetical protein